MLNLIANVATAFLILVILFIGLLAFAYYIVQGQTPVENFADVIRCGRDMNVRSLLCYATN